ncbi:hypothetical protein BGX20_009843 [Mortierella sp. AD010]|nr:hypothetical protein BGX20_009843 [Mortierella sp. AD010]
MAAWNCSSDMTICLSDSLLQLVPTCIIIFSSLAFISAECGRQDRSRHFNQFSSEVVIQGESLDDEEIEETASTRLIKPRRTFSLALLRCLGAFSQIGLYSYLAIRKLEEQNQPTPGIPPPGGDAFEYSMTSRDANEEWPLWLPVMHGIVWVNTYAFEYKNFQTMPILIPLHPRLTLTTHLDIIYLATAGAGLAHFMVYNFGRPLGLWTLDDQISGLSGLVSVCMLVITLATKPLVPPQSEKISRGVISPETRSSIYAVIAFTWLQPMVIKSYTGKLQETDVWAMDKALRVKTVFQEYLENRESTVFVTMFYLFRLRLSLQYIWALAWAGLGMVPPFVVFKLVSFVQDLSTYNRNEAIFYVAVLLASIVARAAVLQHGLHIGQRIGTKAKGMASGLIYEKLSLRKDMDPADYEISGKSHDK